MLGSCAGLSLAFTPRAFSLQLGRLSFTLKARPSVRSGRTFRGRARPRSVSLRRGSARPSSRPSSSARAKTRGAQFNTGTARIIPFFQGRGPYTKHFASSGAGRRPVAHDLRGPCGRGVYHSAPPIVQGNNKGGRRGPRRPARKGHEGTYFLDSEGSERIPLYVPTLLAAVLRAVRRPSKRRHTSPLPFLSPNSRPPKWVTEKVSRPAQPSTAA